MPFLWITHREVVYEPAARKILDQFTDPHDRFHDQLMGIEWLLARTPWIGVPATKEDRSKNVLYVCQGDDLAGTSDVWLLYSYDDERVTVQGINVVLNAH